MGLLLKERIKKFAPIETVLSFKSLAPLKRGGSIVKTLNIGTPRLATVVVLNIEQFNFTMQ